MILFLILILLPKHVLQMDLQGLGVWGSGMAPSTFGSTLLVRDTCACVFAFCICVFCVRCQTNERESGVRPRTPDAIPL
jgi:hypothetical protein